MEYDIKIMDIMKEIGCGDGFHIPVANEENRLLEKEIKELLQKKARLLLMDESLDSELQEHKNIKINLSIQEAQNQKLIIANRQQYETEQHMMIAAQRENDNLCRENKTATKKLNELIKEQNKLESELKKNEEQITKMRETIEWGEETLLAWNNDLAKRNMDVNILESYHLEDNNRFKELDLRRQYLQRDVIERESIVEKEVDQLLQVEREMEQTSKLTRQAQQERNHLLEQWQNAANFFDSNQKETQNIVEEINKIRDAAREVYDNMIGNKQKYQDHLEANEEIENEINEISKVNNDMRLSIQKQLLKNENLQSEVMTAQKTLNILGNTLANDRTKRRHMQNDLAKLKTTIEKKEKDIVALKDSMTKIKDKSMTTEERLKELNMIYENQKSTTEQLLSEKCKVLNMTCEMKNEVRQLQSKIDLMENRLEQSRNEQVKLKKEESKTKQSILEKKEVVYNLSFELETIRMKIAETEGKLDVEETRNLKEKLQTLNDELNQVNDNKHKLQKQLKSTETETQRITKEIAKSTVELETLRNRVKELNILNEGGEKQIQSLKEQKQRYHMEEMMAKLKGEQMKKLTDNECKKLYSLTQQREELAADINKRKAEVTVIYERINAEKKSLLEEKSSMKRKLDALVQYVEQRKIRYQLLTATFGKDECSDDGDGGDQSSFSISVHRIRMTREKLELQEAGDRLDERVQKLETEIRAMENTLRVLNASNNCYKTSLSSVNPASDEYRDMIELEETYENVNKIWSEKKKTLETLENEIRNLEAQYKTCNEELESMINIRDIKESELDRAHKEANEQLMKLDRANSRIQFDLKQITKTFSSNMDKRNALDLIKRDIVLRLTKKINNSVLESLSEMSVRHIGVEPTVKQYLSQKGLNLPIVSGLLMNQIKSSCSSSTVSSIGSNNSVKCNSEEDRRSSYSVVNIEPTPRSYARKSGSSIVNK